MYTADRRGQLLSLQAQAARFAVETEARRSEAAGRQMGFSGVVVGIQEREVEQRIEAMIARLSAHIQVCVCVCVCVCVLLMRLRAFVGA